MPAATAVPIVTGVLGIGGSVASGLIGSSAAKSAAAGQQQAAQQAGQLVTNAVNDVNPSIGAAAGTAGANVTAAAGQAGAGVASAADRANALIDPYSTTGTTATEAIDRAIQSGDFNKTPALSDLQMDPGYAFRLAQGQQALERSAAARGGITSGGYLKALTDYAQGAASQEYQNAFNRFQTDRNNRYNILSGTAGQGMSAGNTEGQNLIGAAQYGGNAVLGAQEYQGNLLNQATQLQASNTIGGAKSAADYLTQGANATAAGKIGSANAITGAIGSGVNAASSAANLWGFLKNPATRNTVPGGPIRSFAKGGVVTKPTIALIGDGGVPEAVVPMRSNNKRKVMNLLAMSGKAA